MAGGRSIAVATSLAGPRVTAAATRRLAHLGSQGMYVAKRISRRAPSNGRFAISYEGIGLELDLEDNVQRELFYLGSYERDLLSLILDELKPDDVFVDVGAHIGIFSLPAAQRITTGRVVAFEAAPDTAAVLRRAAAGHNLHSLTIVNAALGSERGTAELRRSSIWAPGDLSVRSLHGDGEAVAEVSVISFDDWAGDVGLQRLDIVKIDVEGHELQVLAGMKRSLRTYRPRLLIVEVVAAHLGRAGTTPAAIDALLSGLGYRAEGGSVIDIVGDPSAPLWPNVVLRPVGAASSTPHEQTPATARESAKP